MSARRIEAVRNALLHAEAAHVAERHRRAVAALLR
jgi:hypothetical protein